MIRIDLPGYTFKFPADPITWDEFFRICEEREFVFLYQEKTVTGRTSLYNRLVSEKFLGKNRR